jgi:hypothetical protein
VFWFAELYDGTRKKVTVAAEFYFSNSMKELASIIQSFTQRETELYKKLYGSEDPKSPTKTEMLFDYLQSQRQATEREVIKALYGSAKSSVSAFSHLKNKLHKQLRTVLIVSDAEQTDADKDTDFNSVHRELTRLYLESFILIKRRLNETYGIIIKEIYAKAKEYEMFHYWIYSLMNLLAQNASKGEKYIAALSAELEHAMNCYVKYYKGDMMLWQLTPAMYLKNREAEFIDKARDTVKQLIRFAQENPSILLTMTQLEGQMILAEFERKPSEVLAYARKKYELATTAKPLSRRGIIGNSRIQLINALINNQHYEEADSLAYKHLHEIPPQVLISYAEMAFRAALYSKNFSHCEEYLKSFEKNPRFIKDEVLTTHYFFYKAALEFYRKKFDDVFVNIARTGWMLRDKTGWGLGVKLMEILAYIELGQTDMVMFRIKALWQLLYRNQNKNIARIKAISHILYALLQSGFNYRKVVEDEKQKMADLRDGTGIFYWDPTGYEIIRFDWWLSEKMKRIR